MRDRNQAAREARAMLGVSPDADSAQIVRAYRRRARSVHPDVSTEADAGAQFSALWTAYQLLLETAHPPGPAPAGDDRGSLVNRDHRQRVPTLDPVVDWSIGWTGQGVAWLIAGPVRAQPSAPQPASWSPDLGHGRDAIPITARPRTRHNRVEPGHE